MTRAASEAFQALRPGQRTLLYCRSSIIRAHRWGGIWLGDNHSSWSQLLANIQMMPAVQMCGFLYSGADLCGFSEDATPDLALRWLEFGLFTPLMRNHADAASRKQEFYRFADLLPAIRNMLGLRYALLPYTVPVAQPAANTSLLDDTALTFWHFSPDGLPVPYRMYTDDGVTTDTDKPDHWRIVG